MYCSVAGSSSVCDLLHPSTLSVCALETLSVLIGLFFLLSFQLVPLMLAKLGWCFGIWGARRSCSLSGTRLEMQFSLLVSFTMTELWAFSSHAGFVVTLAFSINFFQRFQCIFVKLAKIVLHICRSGNGQWLPLDMRVVMAQRSSSGLVEPMCFFTCFIQQPASRQCISVHFMWCHSSLQTSDANSWLYVVDLFHVYQNLTKQNKNLQE